MLDLGAILKALLAAFLHPPPVPPNPVVTPPSNPPTNPNGPSWLDKFAPVKGQPVTPPAPTPAPNPAPSLVDKVAGIVLDVNHKIPFILGINEYHVPLKGVVIHKLDGATAKALAEVIIANTTAPGEGDSDPFPLSYALACLCLESCFDAKCQNGNLLGSNKQNDPAGYDEGIAQLKLRYIIGQEGIETVDEARAFALDPAKAIPYFVRVMRGHLEQADALAMTLPKNANPVYLNRFAAARMLYNFGVTGGTHMIRDNAPIPGSVLHTAHYDYSFSKTLGVAPVMPLGL